MNNDGTEIFMGGSSVIRLPNHGKDTKEADAKEILAFPIKELKVLANNLLLVQRASDNNLLIYSLSNMSLYKELPGRKSGDFNCNWR